MKDFLSIFTDVIRVATFQNISRGLRDAFPQIGHEVRIERRNAIPGRAIDRRAR